MPIEGQLQEGYRKEIWDVKRLFSRTHQPTQIHSLNSNGAVLDRDAFHRKGFGLNLAQEFSRSENLANQSLDQKSGERQSSEPKIREFEFKAIGAFGNLELSVKRGIVLGQSPTDLDYSRAKLNQDTLNRGVGNLG